MSSEIAAKAKCESRGGEEEVNWRIAINVPKQFGELNERFTTFHDKRRTWPLCCVHVCVFACVG